MPIYIFLSLLIPILIGFFIILLLWPELNISFIELLFAICLAIGVGLGISSCLFFVWIEFVSPSIIGLQAFEITILGVAIAFVVKRHFRFSPVIPAIPVNRIARNLKNKLLIFCLSLLVIYLFMFIIRASDMPLGDGDGFTIWNMRARFIFRAGEYWRDAFNTNLPLPDYPMLIPGSIARGWKYINSESPLVPVIIYLLFSFGVVGLLFSSLSIMRSSTQGLLAAIIILSTYYFVELGPAQLADIPLSFFFLSTIILLSFQDRLVNEKYGFLVLAGITTGLAAWTKNEGLLFVLAISFSLTAIILIRKGWRHFSGKIIYFGLGLFPILIMIMYYKIKLCPPNVFMFHAKYDSLRDISRYFLIFNALLDEFIHWGQLIRLPNIRHLSLTMILLVYLWLLRTRIDKQNIDTVLTTMLVLTIMWSGYFYIYLTTYWDLQMHIDTSLNRLALQLWTPFLFLYFMIVRTPEEALESVLPGGTRSGRIEAAVDS